MDITRKATANWTGAGKDGKGKITTDSKVLDNTQFGYKSRFEDGTGTNPEELVGAAHAGCFSMQLAFNLQEAGFTAEHIETEAKVKLQDGAVSEIHLDTKVRVPDIDEQEFKKLAEDAKDNCPISKLLNAKIIFNSVLE